MGRSATTVAGLAIPGVPGAATCARTARCWAWARPLPVRAAARISGHWHGDVPLSEISDAYRQARTLAHP